ncbi:cation-transporting P-type ATPase [Candidatus Micrarchaeota archaeon]|nr:cation-transporting P-type ATPase [Candidatus Micrarchaeota archaeon]
MKKAYHKSVPDVLREIGTDLKGLDSSEAKHRLEKFGYNEFKEKSQVTLLEVFLRQFRSTLVMLLFLAAAVSIYMDEITEAGIIFAIILINAGIGTYHEYRAESALKALKKMQAHNVMVIRGGHEVFLNAREVVPGDIVLLHAGDRIPADGRIVEAAMLKIDESALTGESAPVQKTHEKISGKKSLADRTNMAYASTFVSTGRGMMVVLATNDETEIGKIYRGVSGEREMFPVQIKINNFSGTLGKLAFLMIVIFTLFFGVFLGEQYGYGTEQMFELGIAQAVSFIPEGLPIVVTIALAIGVSEMAKKRALSRKLQAIETVGRVDCICVDKTGTLTLNKMTVRELVLGSRQYSAGGGTSLSYNGQIFEAMALSGFRNLLETGILCNDSNYDAQADKRIGEPLEIAIVEYALNFSINREKYSIANPREAEIQFDPKNKYMITVNKTSLQERTFHLKGSPEAVVKMCTHIRDAKGSRKITSKDLEVLVEKTNSIASKGLRVLAFAHKPDQKKIKELESGYTFLGLIGFQDPLRPDVAESIKKAHEAGIKVVMITGDHRITAESIALEAGIITGRSDQLITGEEMDKKNDDQLLGIIRDIRVFARVTSEHKAKIVKLLKESGSIVSMTGDGVNDAIALKDAHVGVALGSGTDVAKEASDIVITDDNFTSIVNAVEEGRHSSANLRKVIKYLFATNVTEVLFLFAILLSPFWSGSLLPLALLPIHILYINLVTDGVCDVTLATEKKDRHLMKQKPADFSGSLFPKDVVRFIVISAIIILPGLFLTYLYYLNLPGSTIEHTRTVTFTLLAFFQFWSAINARSIIESAFSIGFFTNKYLNVAIIGSILIQLCVIYVPEINQIMKTEPLNLMDWMLIVGISSTLFILFEVLKFFHRRGYPVFS